MKQISTQAIILKRINFGEADRILTVLTSDHGQVSILAKGVRKAKSKLAGGLELFSVSDINYIDGKSDLKTTVSTRLKVHFKNIVSDVNRTMVGYDFIKVLTSFSEHSKEPEYYTLLEKGLESLDDLNINVSLVEVWFYSKLLALNGSGINIEKPLDEAKFSETEMYDFSFDDMCFYVSKSGKFGPNHIKFLRLVNKSVEPKQLLTINDHDLLAGSLQETIKQSAIIHKA
jgi:DNA repair protein RecO (recombination protein O)